LAAVGESGVAGAQSLTEALGEAYRINPQLLAQRLFLRAHRAEGVRPGRPID
jgi:hypothetical protein